MIKGHTYDKQLYNSVAHRLLNREFLDNENGIINQGNKCSMTHTTNSITVNDGFIVIQGGITEIENSNTVSVELDDSYCKLVYELDLSKTNDESNFNQGILKVISSSSAYPSLTQQILTENSGIYQYELAQFKAALAGITDFIDRRTYLRSGDTLDWLRAALGLDNDTYDNTSTYSVGDMVIYQSKIYECTTAVSTAENFDVNKWTLVPILSDENMKLNNKLKENFAILNGSLSDGEATANYPNGFTRDNCVVISIMFSNTNTNNWGVGTLFDSTNVIVGTVPCDVKLRTDNIGISTKNIGISHGVVPAVNTVSVQLQYKLVLMKY